MRRRALVLMWLALTLGACAVPALPVEPSPTPSKSRPPTFTRVPTLAQNTPTAMVTAGPRSGGELVQALERDAVSLHPYLTTDRVSALYQANLYARGLWTPDPQTLEPSPNMAQSWTVSSDGKTYSFRLRQDMTWSDGQPLTAADFQWTYDQAIQTIHKYPYAENLREIASYKASDPYTLQVVLKQASCVGLIVVDGIVPLPKHIWQKLDWSDSAKNPEINHPTVVSGPFQLVEWKKNDHATFVRNPSFYRGPSLLDRYTITVVTDEPTRLGMLKKGQIDWATASPSANAELETVDSLREFEWDPAAATLDYIGFNLRRPFFQDVQVRRALAMAIPRQEISDQVFRGHARPAFSVYPSTSWAFNLNIPRYEYDPDGAKSALQKAGYRLDSQGRLLDKAGKPVRLDIVFNENNAQYAQIARIAEGELRKLGIDSDLNPLDFESLLEHLRTSPYNYDLYILGWTVPAEPYFLNQIWSSKNVPDLNSGAYNNPEIEKLYEESNRPPCDTRARKETFGRIQTTLTSDMPYALLTFRKDFAWLNRRVVPNLPSPLGIAYRPEQWYVLNP